jgi:N-acetylmuramoyl-L-alanine amidase
MERAGYDKGCRMKRFLPALTLAVFGMPGVALAESALRKCDREHFAVAVDVGHSSQDPGALSARGVPEYEFNLSLARKIGKKLTNAGYRKTTVMITAGRGRPALSARVARANAMPADLFLSVHHDSVPERFLETWAYEGRQNRFNDSVPGHSLFVSFENGQAQASLAFAQLIGAELKRRGLQYTSHYTEPVMAERRRELVDPQAGVYRYDQLVVLRETEMPAVLLEAGSIINRREELDLGSPKRVELVAGAVTAAVETYCKEQVANRRQRASS